MKKIQTGLVLILGLMSFNLFAQTQPNNKAKAQTNDLFKISFSKNNNYLLIEQPKGSGFYESFGGDDANYEPYPTNLNDTYHWTDFQRKDFNGDHKEDLLVNLGGWGTGGMAYAVFIQVRKHYYTLAFEDYLKNMAFERNKNGFIDITSSETVRAGDPSKVDVTTYKFDPKTTSYYKANSYLYVDNEDEKMAGEATPQR